MALFNRASASSSSKSDKSTANSKKSDQLNNESLENNKSPSHANEDLKSMQEEKLNTSAPIPEAKSSKPKSNLSTEVLSPIIEQKKSHSRKIDSPFGKSATSQSSPRFINPAKITKPRNEDRCIGSYLNQQQLYILRQREHQITGKLEKKSISQLQMLQHKASRSDASNKIKNLIQEALFKKHMSEMKEWENQLDSSPGKQQDERSTRAEQQKTQELQNQTLEESIWIPKEVFEQLE
ncbi:unnamed protein product [Aureobasidium vineae]|uniref:Uncharacterized protein n=1 Tax=Aureobasidium vineae TaxID=2773715 RepID=A0A9N8J7L3_9PEZI|nr:unnamed protein product [Aureobasidium vineae]